MGDSLRRETTVEPRNPGWAARLPVRADHVEVEKQLVVYERVVVRRQTIADPQHIETTVRREELRIERDDDDDDDD
jgi:uncharacterized protein (TIGR02271 family)